ncbi:MAG: MarR family transcriptional regulator [Thioalkalispiraceae bacterium]|jgi:DNA-binding MarR family transcriptional regulator
MFEKCIYFNSNAFVRKLNRIWEEAYQPTGLSPAHAYLLRLVCHEPGITQKEAGQYLKLEKSTITRFVSGLEERGLLSRKSGESGREVRLQATVSGQRLGAQLDEIGAGLYKKMRKQFGAQQFDELVNLLRVSPL